MNDSVLNGYIEKTTEILRLMGEIAEVSWREQDDRVIVDVEVADPGPLIGREGNGLEALQLILNRMMRKGRMEKGSPSVIIDINGYRRSREVDLIQMAKDIADKVSRSHKSVLLEPMNSWERRVVHMAVREEEEIVTESEDSEEGRRVRIIPAEPEGCEEGGGAEPDRAFRDEGGE